MDRNEEPNKRELLNDSTRVVRVHDFDTGQVKYMTVQQAADNGMVQVLN